MNNSEKTKDAFSTDGWLKTGDVFQMDKYGNYYCVDRLKELIKYSERIALPLLSRVWQQRTTNTAFRQRASRSPQPSWRGW